MRSTVRDALDFRRKFPTPTATLDFYRGVQAAENRYALVSEFEIASPTGKAFRVNGGQIARFLVVSHRRFQCGQSARAAMGQSNAQPGGVLALNVFATLE